MQRIPSILIVGGHHDEREPFAAGLRRSGYHVATARDAAQAFALLDLAPYDLLIAEAPLPDAHVLDLLRQAAGRLPQLKAIVLAARGSPQDAVEAIKAGADDYLTGPVAPQRLLTAVRTTLAGGRPLRPEPGSLTDLTQQTVRALVRAAEMRDRYTAGHSARVARFAVALARDVGLAPPEVEELRVAALLHDVGKIGVSDAVLNKPGSLSPEEWASIREHPAMGCRIIGCVQALAPALPLVLHHQERYDGRGYPAGLTGEEIPFGARILAVADAFEALTADRAYRPGQPPGQALQILAAGAASQWDPTLVDRWLRLAGRPSN